MNTISGRVIASVIIMIAMVSLVAAQAGPSKRPLNEDMALDLLLRTIKRDHVYAKRISLDCVTFGTEEAADAYSNSCSAKIIRKNAAAISMLVRSSIATVFIARREKLNGWTR
jgi:hypothetical protein